MYNDSELENSFDIFRKAKAKKQFAKNPVGNYHLTEDDRNRLLTALNKQLLDAITEIIQKNPTANLSGVEKLYRQESRRITGIYDSLYAFTSTFKSKNDQKQSSSSNQEKSMQYCKDRHPTKLFTESFLTLASVMGINPLVSKDDFLAALLEQSFDMFEDDKQPFKYIKVSDVIKTRGNAINGPRREDIGYYNRKLFENYTNEISKTSQDRAFVNLKFFPKYDHFIKDETVITSDLVIICVFRGSIRERFEQCLFIVHQKDNKKRCTAFYGDHVVFNMLEKDQFKYSLSKCKRKINMLHFETLMLYSIEFLCTNAAASAYSSFFNEAARVNYFRGFNFP